MKEVNRESVFVDEFFDIACFHFSLWEAAARRQIERVNENDDPEDRLAEFVFLIVALHNFIVSFHRYRDELKHAVGNGPGSGSRRRAARWADKGITVLESGFPQIRDLRNIFSHFEEYAFGVGNRQRSGVPISVKHGGSNIFVIKDGDVRYEINLVQVKAVLDDVRRCYVEILTYFDD